MRIRWLMIHVRAYPRETLSGTEGNCQLARMFAARNNYTLTPKTSDGTDVQMSDWHYDVTHDTCDEGGAPEMLRLRSGRGLSSIC